MPMQIKSLGSSTDHSLSDYEVVETMPQKPKISSLERGWTIKEKGRQILRLKQKTQKTDRRESFRPQMEFIALAGSNFNKTF